MTYYDTGMTQCHYCGKVAFYTETFTYWQEGVKFDGETRKVCRDHAGVRITVRG